MKKLILIFFVGLRSLSIYAQVADSITVPTLELDSTPKITMVDSLTLDLLNQIAHQTLVPRYKIYKTENTYNLLKLDTRLGKVWMVQYGMKGTAEPMTIQIDEAVLWGNFEQFGYNGRFELYPTNNVYNFIMLDTKYGDTYQVQWYVNDENKRFVRLIPN